MSTPPHASFCLKLVLHACGRTSLEGRRLEGARRGGRHPPVRLPACWLKQSATLPPPPRRCPCHATNPAEEQHRSPPTPTPTHPTAPHPTPHTHHQHHTHTRPTSTTTHTHHPSTPPRACLALQVHVVSAQRRAGGASRDIGTTPPRARQTGRRRTFAVHVRSAVRYALLRRALLRDVCAAAHLHSHMRLRSTPPSQMLISALSSGRPASSKYFLHSTNERLRVGGIRAPACVLSLAPRSGLAAVQPARLGCREAGEGVRPLERGRA